MSSYNCRFHSQYLICFVISRKDFLEYYEVLFDVLFERGLLCNTFVWPLWQYIQKNARPMISVGNYEVHCIYIRPKRPTNHTLPFQDTGLKRDTRYFWFDWNPNDYGGGDWMNKIPVIPRLCQQRPTVLDTGFRNLQ